jgi:hypothetical protein
MALVKRGDYCGVSAGASIRNVEDTPRCATDLTFDR